MRPGIPDSGQAAKRDSLWVLDIESSNHSDRERRMLPPLFTTHISPGDVPLEAANEMRRGSNS